MARILDLRPDDRRNTIVAFASLFLVMVGHAVLETARDALFLAKLPAAHLPWAYLAIAAAAVLLTGANRQCSELVRPRSLLTSSLVVAAVATAGMWALVGNGGDAVLYAFYIWTGVVATVVVVQFWLLLSDVFTVTQAKRVYALVGAGGTMGAVVGASLAGALLMVVEARALVLVGAAVFGAAAAVPMLMRTPPAAEQPRRERTSRPATQPVATRVIVDHPYLRRLFALVLLGTLTVTTTDFVFKSAVAASVAPEQLGEFFARYYAGLNALALVVQVLFASWLLRVAGVNRTLLVLPVLLLGGAAAFAIAPTLLVALVLKGSDGSLRHSVNRTGMELLYVPLSTEVRHRLKAMMDSVGQRGGQALASLAILGAVAIGAGPRELAIAIGALALLWGITLMGIQRHYLELFRQHLRAGTIEPRMDLPELDLHTLETLVVGLNSDNDAEVVSALDMFREHGKARLIPALILYHPSSDVVRRALELLVESGRTDWVSIARRLLERDDDELRAAALRAINAVAPDERLLRLLADDASARVRASAAVCLYALGMETDDGPLRELARDGSPEARHALARAIRYIPPHDGFATVLIELGRSRGPDVQSEVARAIALAPHLKYLPTLLAMLGVRRARAAAREAIAAIGAPALDFLDGALSDPELPLQQRRHLPRTISRFGSEKAAAVLVRHLTDERDGMTRFKILRGLGRMVTDDPRLRIDRDAIRTAAHDTLRRVIELLAWRVHMERELDDEPELRTPGAGLLLSLMREKQLKATERLFRLLDLLRPRENFQLIYHGLFGGDAKARASAGELLEHSVDAELRAPVLALVDDVPDPVKLARAAPFADPPAIGYRVRLRALLDDGSEAMRAITAYHIAELGLRELRGDLEVARTAHHPGYLREVVDRALALLAQPLHGVPHASS